MKQGKNGFSLVELSIVLVILGLLTGGILSGQSLIRASELRSVTADFSRYSSAVYAFRDKYFALPGDMPNATNFWGSADGGSGSGPDCTAAVTNDTRTCNGNGDGNISEYTGATMECFRAWQHLANAGMVEGQYSGVNGSGTSNYNAVLGVNIPKSRVSNAGWALHSAFTADATNVGHFPKQYQIRLMFGGVVPNGTVSAPVFKPEEMWNIDTKLDDGKPSTGKIMTYDSSAANAPCATSDVVGSAEYPLTVTTITCALIGQPGV